VLHIPDWEDWDPPDYIGVFKKGDIVGYSIGWAGAHPTS